MPIHLLRQIYRERRRVTLLVVLVFVALRLAAPGWAAEPLVAAGLALGLGAGFAALSVLAPSLRGYTEVAAIASLGLAVLVRSLPGGALDPAAWPPGNLLVAVGIWLGLAALARGLLRALEALPLPRFPRRRFQARAGSRVDIHRLWHGLVPTPARGPRTDDRDRSAIEDMTLRIGRVRLVDPVARAASHDTPLQILEVEAPFHVRLRARDGDGLMDATGISEIFLVELGAQRLVLFAHEFFDMPFGRAVLAWLDDAPGRVLDRRLAVIERQAATGRATTLSDWDADSARDEPADSRHAS